ncbi:MAG: COX15/CtaA family protein [Xanthomonadaceae bacterium]|nr:COX15/CtaA family protein [Xanthomonadaceae bacterium]
MKLFRILAWSATAFTLLVIVAGAWVRLTDAGLGCPDWPGCYGMPTWPEAPEHVDQANAEWGHLRPVDSGKAFREMLHRYLAGLLGFLVLALAVVAWRNHQRNHQSGCGDVEPSVSIPRVLPGLILLLVIFQAALGMWTVTLLLKPAIVTAHLIGGMTTFALLFWLSLSVTPRRSIPSLPARAQHWPVVVALIVVAIQIILGGWVSTNYAALACSDFPRCGGQWWPQTDFTEGFRLWRGVGVDYEGGLLDQPARIAVHLAHRVWALVVVATFAWLTIRLWRAEDLTKTVPIVILLLATQVALGIYNVVGSLPLINAVAHNGVAALLLGLMISLLDKTRLRPAEQH